jgi:hypothetical protein
MSMQLLRLACGAMLVASVMTVYDGLKSIGGVSPATDRYVTQGPPTPTVSVVSDESSQVGDEDEDFSIDRFGNRIDRAIGDYRVDPRGDIFEWHSPSTAVSRLADPSS